MICWILLNDLTFPLLCAIIVSKYSNQFKVEGKMSSGDKFKQLEQDMRSVLPTRKIIGMRLDGKSFHSFTKQYERPFDMRFMFSMNAIAEGLITDHLTGALFSYVQSDEITVFFTDKWNEKTEYFFNGKIEKILSTSASFATGAFLKNSANIEGIPVFDARMFVLENMDEVQEYMDWRRLDARKNAVSMAAHFLYGDKKLRNVSTTERKKLLEGTEYENLPDGFFNGRIMFKKKFEETISYIHGKTGEEKTTTVERTKTVSEPASRELTAEIIDSFRWMDK